jgi:hypothetical protein
MAAAKAVESSLMFRVGEIYRSCNWDLKLARGMVRGEIEEPLMWNPFCFDGAPAPPASSAGVIPPLQFPKRRVIYRVDKNKKKRD